MGLFSCFRPKAAKSSALCSTPGKEVAPAISTTAKCEKGASPADSLTEGSQISSDRAELQGIDASAIKLSGADEPAAGKAKSSSKPSGEIHAEAHADTVHASPRDENDIRSPIPSPEQAGQQTLSPPHSLTKRSSDKWVATEVANTLPAATASPVKKPFSTLTKTSPRASPAAAAAAATPSRAADRAAAAAAIAALPTPAKQRASPKPKTAEVSPRTSQTAPVIKQSPTKPLTAKAATLSPRTSAKDTAAERSPAKAATLSPRASPKDTAAIEQSPAKSSVTKATTVSPRTSQKNTATEQSPAKSPRPATEQATATTTAGVSTEATKAVTPSKSPATQAAQSAGSKVVASPRVEPSPATTAESAPRTATTPTAVLASPTVTKVAIPSMSPRPLASSPSKPSQKTTAVDTSSPAAKGGAAQRPGWQSSSRVPNPKPFVSGINTASIHSPRTSEFIVKDVGVAVAAAPSPIKPSPVSKARLASSLTQGSTHPMDGPMPSESEPARATKMARSAWQDGDVLTRSAALRTFLPGTSEGGGSRASEGGAKKGKKRTHKPRYKKTPHGTTRRV